MLGIQEKGFLLTVIYIGQYLLSWQKIAFVGSVQYLGENKTNKGLELTAIACPKFVQKLIVNWSGQEQQDKFLLWKSLGIYSSFYHMIHHPNDLQYSGTIGSGGVIILSCLMFFWHSHHHFWN